MFFPGSLYALVAAEDRLFERRLRIVLWSLATLVLSVIVLLPVSIQIGWITWETRVNIIKVTYEFEGVQTVEVVDERDTGPLTIFYMERFVIRQNNLASNGDGLTRRVIALERCPHQKPCEDWMPQLKDGKWEVRD